MIRFHTIAFVALALFARAQTDKDCAACVKAAAAHPVVKKYEASSKIRGHELDSYRQQYVLTGLILKHCAACESITSFEMTRDMHQSAANALINSGPLPTIPNDLKFDFSDPNSNFNPAQTTTIARHESAAEQKTQRAIDRDQAEIKSIQSTVPRDLKTHSSPTFTQREAVDLNDVSEDVLAGESANADVAVNADQPKSQVVVKSKPQPTEWPTEEKATEEGIGNKALHKLTTPINKNKCMIYADNIDWNSGVTLTSPEGALKFDARVARVYESPTVTYPELRIDLFNEFPFKVVVSYYVKIEGAENAEGAEDTLYPPPNPSSWRHAPMSGHWFLFSEEKVPNYKISEVCVSKSED